MPDITNHRDPFKDVLIYEDQLPLQWQAVEWPVNINRLESLNRENELLFQVLLSRDEALAEKEDELSESITELKHLETKVNLLLNWVGHLMMQAAPLPECQPIKISAFGFAFMSSTALQPDDYCLVEWFPDSHYPQAIKLFVKVLECTRDTDTTDTGTNGQLLKIITEFAGVSEQLQDSISKYIFRHHRRCIAQQKRMKQQN
ncbi:MAG: hypothetical protein GXP08_04760 [Gammaproteobacteria bacterium]|nr:hypothetical protein [Gammaproteobacteria bacterium]